MAKILKKCDGATWGAAAVEQAGSKRKMDYTWDVGLYLEGRLGCSIGPYRGDPRLGCTDCGFSPSPMSTASTKNIVPFPQLRDQARRSMLVKRAT